MDRASSSLPAILKVPSSGAIRLIVGREAGCSVTLLGAGTAGLAFFPGWLLGDTETGPAMELYTLAQVSGSLSVKVALCQQANQTGERNLLSHFPPFTVSLDDRVNLCSLLIPVMPWLAMCWVGGTLLDPCGLFGTGWATLNSLSCFRP